MWLQQSTVQRACVLPYQAETSPQHLFKTRKTQMNMRQNYSNVVLSILKWNAPSNQKTGSDLVLIAEKKKEPMEKKILIQSSVSFQQTFSELRPEQRGSGYVCKETQLTSIAQALRPMHDVKRGRNRATEGSVCPV